MAGYAQVLPFESRPPSRESPVSHLLIALFVPGGVIALMVIGLSALARGARMLFGTDSAKAGPHAERYGLGSPSERALGTVVLLEPRRRARQGFPGH